ncbi:MAG: nitroreductase family protein [Actinobacteria bacterium]|nr:nitroreductase family protein [Actinomycetota bacterium]
MTLDLTPDELLTTTRAVRKRLDLERPVERSVIEECVRIAMQAPTGSNAQGWHFVFVEDPAKKKALADLYGQNFDPYFGSAAPTQYPEGDTRGERQEFVRGSAMYLRQHFHEVPVMMIPCITGRLPDGTPAWIHASVWGSLLPAVWSFMLAARARGLGTAWTTLHLPNEREAADLLGIPYDKVMQGGLIPIAYTKGTDFKPAPRLPVDQIVHWNEW